MSLKHAIEFSKELNSFKSLKDAQKYFERYNEHYLSKIIELSKKYNKDLNNTPESLKIIESWYFDLYEQDFKDFPINIIEFEKCMAIYFLNVAVKNNRDVVYKVSEYTFVKGKYEFGVEYNSLTYNSIRFKEYFKTPNNKKRQSLFKKYKKYFM